MASLFGALGSLAESYGLARQNVEESNLRRVQQQMEQTRLQMQQEQLAQSKARMLFEESQARRPLPFGQAYKKDGKWVQPIWDPLAKGGQGGLSEIEEGAVENPLMELQRQVKEAGGYLPLDKAESMLFPQAAKQEQPQYEKSVVMAPNRQGKLVPTIAYVNKSDPTKPPIIEPLQAYEKTAAGGGGELPDKTVAALADRWNKYGDKPPAKYQVQVESYMEDHDMAPGRKLSAQENRVLDVMKQAQPLVTRLKQLIEDHGLTGENSYVFSHYSALAQHMRNRGVYALGVKPDQVAADLIKDAGAIQVMGTAPWTVIGRGKYTTEIIQQHLPKPTDTPALLYDKINFFQGIIDDAKADISGAGAIGDSDAQPSGAGKPHISIDSKGNITVR